MPSMRWDYEIRPRIIVEPGICPSFRRTRHDHLFPASPTRQTLARYVNRVSSSVDHANLCLIARVKPSQLPPSRGETQPRRWHAFSSSRVYIQEPVEYRPYIDLRENGEQSVPNICCTCHGAPGGSMFARRPQRSRSLRHGKHWQNTSIMFLVP